MRLNGRRKSTNVEDRRGSSGGGGGIDIGDILGKIGGAGRSSGGSGSGLPGGMGGMSQLSGCSGGKGGCSIFAVILVVLLVLVMCNGGLGGLLGGGGGGGMLNSCAEGGGFGDIFSGQVENQTTKTSTASPEEESEVYDFVLQILGSTEDVWTKEFEKMGKTYKSPSLVLYSGRTQTACGVGQAAMGPFYCSGDQKIYLDLSFFETMRSELGAIKGPTGDFSEGDFACAYVIAHEVGHHVQNMLGTLSKAHAKMNQLSQSEANKVSVQIELQADFLAGLWGHDENEMFGSLEDGDLEEALATAIAIGDDYLQKRAGYSNPQGYTHGTSAQRKKWFKRGFDSGDINRGNTFAVDYEDL